MRLKPRKETLHAKIQRYEALLRSYGAKIEPSESPSDRNSESTSPADVEMIDDAASLACGIDSSEKPTLITKEGHSRYFDRYGPRCRVFRCNTHTG